MPEHRPLNKVFSILSIIAMMIPILPAQPAAAATCTPISSAAGIDAIRTNLAGSYCLTADIDLSGTANFVPIGSIRNGDGTLTFVGAFSGSLDGQGYTIKNVNIDQRIDSALSYLGFFSQIEGGDVSFVRFENITIKGGTYTGAVAGLLDTGYLADVEVLGSVSSNAQNSGTYTGGLAGKLNFAFIETSSFIGDITGKSYIGGLVGLLGASSDVEQSFADANIKQFAISNYTDFDGSTGYIRIPDTEAYHTSSFTMEAWFYWDKVASADPNADVQFITGKGFENFEIHTAGGSGTNGVRFIPVKRTLTVGDSANAYLDVYNVLGQKWVHVAVTWDLENEQGRVLINGVPQDIYQLGVNSGTTATVDVDEGVDPLEGNVHPFVIGARTEAPPTSSSEYGMTYFFDGKIADVRFWNKVRTPEQIAADYDKTLSGDEDGLIGYWKLNEGSGAALDSSSVANNGSLVGGVSRIIATPPVVNGIVGATENSGWTMTANYFVNADPAYASSTNGIGVSRSAAKVKATYPSASWIFGEGFWQIEDGRTYPTHFTFNPTVTLDALTTTSFDVGEKVTVTYKVSDHYIGTPGTVTVGDGTDNCTGTATDGTCDITFTSAGSKTIKASIAADTVFSAAESATQDLTISKVDTTTTISSVSKSSTVVGEAYTVNVSVIAADASVVAGNVSVSDGTNDCDATIANGTGSCSLTPTAPSSATITATFDGSAKYNTSSDTEAHTVTKANTTTSITSDTPDPSVSSGPVAVAVSVSPVSPGAGTPSGKVLISGAGSVSCEATLASGVGSCNIGPVSTGNISAAYQGDTNFNTSNTTTAHTVNAASSSTSITLPTTATVAGEQYSVSANVSAVSPATATPTGTVTISDGSAECSITLASGTGSCNLTTTTVGSKTISATYAGDTNFGTSSDSGSHTVNKADTTVTILTDTPDPTVIGQGYRVTAKVEVNSPSTLTISSGAIKISDGTNEYSATLVDSNQTGYDFTSTVVGEKTITATFESTELFNSDSDTDTHTIGKAATSLTVTPTKAITTLDEEFDIEVSVSVTSPGAGSPSGTITLTEGSTQLCSKTIADGKISCTISFSSYGSKTIKAAYSGDAKFAASEKEITHAVQGFSLSDNKTSTARSIIGDLSVSGASAPVTYALANSGEVCDATNGADNASFELDGSTLNRKAATVAGEYSICAQATDNDGVVNQSAFTIVINDPPSLDETSLDNDAINIADTLVGTLTASDGRGTMTYGLSSGSVTCDATAAADNDKFTIGSASGEIERKASTTSGEYKVCAIVTDAEEDTAEFGYTITIVDSPSAMKLSNNKIYDDWTEVGTLSVTGGLDPITFDIATSGDVCTTTNGADNGSFEIDGSTLKPTAGIQPGQYAICVQAEDDLGETTQSAFDINVYPGMTELSLTSSVHRTDHELVGTFAVDGGIFPITFSIEDAASCSQGSNDNADFSITGSGLIFGGSAENTTERNICVKATDAEGEAITQDFVITVERVDPQPTDWSFELSSNMVIDDDPAGVVVGSLLSTVDNTVFTLVDAEVFPYEEYFTIDGIYLTIAKDVDLDQVTDMPIRIQGTTPADSVKYLDVVIIVKENGLLSGMMMEPDLAESVDGGTVEVDITGNDILSNGASGWGDLEIARHPENGTATIGSIIYTPNAGFSGMETITYRVCDDQDKCGLGTLSVSAKISAKEASEVEKVPDTGFAPSVVTQMAEQPVAATYQNADGMRLVIPKLDVDVSVVGVPVIDENWDVSWLGNNAGWLNGTAYPTHEGNSVITAHVTNWLGEMGPFGSLKELKYGDHFMIALDGIEFVYEVRENFLITPTSVWTMMRHKEDSSWMTLVTCEGYEEGTDSYRSRRMVRAVLVSTW